MTDTYKDLSDRQAKRWGHAHVRLYHKMPSLRSKPNTVEALDGLTIEGRWEDYENALSGLSDEELADEALRRQVFSRL